MHVAGSLTDWRCEDQFRPSLTGGDLNSVPRFGAKAEADRAEDGHERVRVEVVDPDLDVEAILGGEARYRCGSDVVNTLSERSERCLEPGGKGAELPQPLRIVGDDRQAGGQLIGERHTHSVENRPGCVPQTDLR